MTATDIPYHLRNGKFADRALFVELLRRLERWRPLDDYTYVSMGGYTMSDHIRVLRVLGLERLVSFDSNKDVVRRAKFNRPTDVTFVQEATAKDVADRMDELLTEWGVPLGEGRIVWFDFTTPRRLQEDLSCFATLVSTSAPGDVLRITLNADPRNLPMAKTSGEEITEEACRTVLKNLRGGKVELLQETW